MITASLPEPAPDLAPELVMIRHADAAHGGRLCGRTDVAAMIPDAQRPAIRLWGDAHARTRVVSPALRCRQTAEALWSAPASVDDRLWEQHFGDHENLPFERLPDLGDLSLAALADHCPPGGESFAAMVSRVRPALRHWSAIARAQGMVAIVAHAGTVRAALALAIDHIPGALAFEVAPLSVNRFRVLEEGLSVISVNQPMIAPVT